MKKLLIGFAIAAALFIAATPAVFATNHEPDILDLLNFCFIEQNIVDYEKDRGGRVLIKYECPEYYPGLVFQVANLVIFDDSSVDSRSGKDLPYSPKSLLVLVHPEGGGEETEDYAPEKAMPNAKILAFRGFIFYCTVATETEKTDKRIPEIQQIINACRNYQYRDNPAPPGAK
jgi:hypothetical protein